MSDSYSNHKKNLLIIKFDLLRSESYCNLMTKKPSSKSFLSQGQKPDNLSPFYINEKYFKKNTIASSIDKAIHLQQLDAQGLEVVILSPYEKIETYSQLILLKMNNLNPFIRCHPPSKFEEHLAKYSPYYDDKIQNSYFVTDDWHDLSLAGKLGLTTVGILKGSSQSMGIKKQQPDYMVRSIRDIKSESLILQVRTEHMLRS